MIPTLTLARPVPKSFKISSPFGNRLMKGKLVHHNGIDFATPVGTPVMAVADGPCVRAGWENASEPSQGYGLRVMQRISVDGKFFYFWYAHLSALKVEADSEIKKGQVIGLSGNTGRSTGPHLHVGARRADSGEFYDLRWEPEAVA